MNELTLLIIIKLGELMTLKLDGVEAHSCPCRHERLKEHLKLSILIVILQVFFYLVYSSIFSLEHIVELINQVIR
jgi:hypothetical protein